MLIFLKKLELFKKLTSLDKINIMMHNKKTMSSNNVTVDISSGKIYNPITKHEVKITSIIGKKLLKLRERGETIVSQADGYIELVRILCPDKDDNFIKNVISSVLKPECRNAIASSIPVVWGGGKMIDDSDKKPKKVTAKKLFSIDQRDVMIKEHPEYSLKDINSMVSSKWLKISNKDRKDRSEFQKYKKLADDANEDFEERMEKYKELHKNDPPRKLSQKDQEKIDAGTHVINPESGRPMKIREEKQKKEKTKKRETPKNENSDEEEDKEEEEEVKPVKKATKKVVKEESESDEEEEEVKPVKKATKKVVKEESEDEFE